MSSQILDLSGVRAFDTILNHATLYDSSEKGKRKMTYNFDAGRRDFLKTAGAAAGLACIQGCVATGGRDDSIYSVAVLGDTHYDAEPESVYHSHYDESNRWAKIQHSEFRRNGEMWRERCPKMIAASAALARRAGARFVLQLGDIIQGDCDHVPTHKKMLDDCIKLLRGPYPDGLPFLTVMGNHDFRGKGAREAYLEFAEPFIANEIRRLTGKDFKVKYPAFSFRLGQDLWVFCDFETTNLNPICDLIDADAAARRVFLVTHGPFTTFPFGSPAYRWRLGGRRECEASRPRLYETLSRRHAVVLSGHTHTTCFYRHENKFGGFAECTVNCVWKSPDLATAKPEAQGPDGYRALPGDLPPKMVNDLKSEVEFFRPNVKDCFFNYGAGHYRLDVSGKEVAMSFYPGASNKCARRFILNA